MTRKHNYLEIVMVLPLNEEQTATPELDSSPLRLLTETT
jgi:hypothetical protein